MTSVDVEGLFRKFGVAEVKEIEKKVKNDIEQKKEDLRNMVGRRYRDIIEAADSINEMKSMSENIMVSFKEVHQGFCRLQELQQQLTTAQQRAHLISQPPINQVFQSDALLKLLLDIPEMVWESLEDGSSADLLSAVWCLLLGEHVADTLAFRRTSSQQSTNDSNGDDRSAIVDKQASKLKRLRRTIMTKCQQAFGQCDGNKQSAEYCCENLTAVLLLEGVGIEELLKRLLSSTKDDLSSLFTDGSKSSREQICECLSVIVSTVTRVSIVFAPSDMQTASFLMSSVTEILNERWQPNVLKSYLKLQSRSFNAAVSTELKDFRPPVSTDPVDLGVDQLKAILNSWLEDILETARVSVDSTLPYFETIDALTNLKRSVGETISEADTDRATFSQACRTVIGGELSLWHSLLKDSMEKRVAELLSNGVSDVFQSLLTSAFENQETLIAQFPNYNDFVWKGSASDSIFPALLATDEVVVSQLTLKARGVLPAVYSLCKVADESLKNFHESIENYLKSVSPVHTTVDELFAKVLDVCPSDTERLWKLYGECCSDNVKKFCKDITEQNVRAAEMTDAERLQRSMVSTQLCQCLCELTPALKKALSTQRRQRPPISGATVSERRSTSEDDPWVQTKNLLLETSLTAYTPWVKIVVEKALLESKAVESLHCFRENRTVTNSLEWETVSLEEETESGEKVASRISVPMSPSRYLHWFFESLCDSLTAVGAHRLPKRVRENVSRNAYAELVKLLSEETSESTSLTQKSAVQLLFDCRVLMSLMGHKSLKGTEHSNQELMRLITSLESRIDPFDLDVMTPYLKKSVTKTLSRITCVYGVALTPETWSSLGRLTAAAKTADDAQLLPLNSQLARFTLLPVVTPPNTTAVGKTLLHAPTASVGFDRYQKTTVSSTADPSKTTTSSSLSTFYDKISTSWFG